MVTANHCGTGISWKTPAGAAVGTSGSGNSGVDAMIITGQNYAGTIYTGTYTAATSKPVYAVYDPQVGDTVCVSGAYSGSFCGAKVQYANYYIGGVGPGFTAWDPNYLALAGPGDSGGPRYQTTGSGVLVTGIIRGGIQEDTANCRGASGRLICFWKIFAIYPNSIMAALNLQIIAS